MFTLDRRTIDSAGSFLIQELERLDPMIHQPLQEFTWSRDIDVRSDVTMGDDFSSFTTSAMAGIGGIDPNAKAWISKNTTNLPTVALDIGKTPSPLFPWGMELGFSVYELAAAMQLNRGIDEEKFSAMNIKHQQDTDIQVYLGDSVMGVNGLWNSAQVTNNTQVALNAGATSRKWSAKTPDEILADVNEILMSAYIASGFSICPSKLALPPLAYAYIISQKVSSAGNISIMEFLKQNSICLAKNGKALEIVDQKWLIGTNGGGQGPGTGGDDRMVAYTQDYRRVRFPMVPMQGLPMQLRGIHQVRPYFCKLGAVEFVYPECVAYRDGIN
jgi:hypothetical protein